MQRTTPELTAAARDLRNNATPAERLLWRHFKTVQPRFTRQLVISHYIADFACRSLKLAIKLDGGHHATQEQQDANRTAYLEANDWTVLRFWNNDVVTNPDGVMQTILEAVSRAQTHPFAAIPTALRVAGTLGGFARSLPFREGSVA